MKRRGFPAFPLLLVGLAIGAPTSLRAEYLTQLIVKFKNPSEVRARTLSVSRMRALSTSAGNVPLTFLRQMSGQAHVLKLPGAVTVGEVEEMARRLSRDPEIEYAVPDYRRKPLAAPNDELYSLQWHYHAAPLEPAAANLPEAWDITKGTYATVTAVLDTGILSHGDLIAAGPSPRVLAGYDFIVSTAISNDGDGRDAIPADTGDFITAAEDAGIPGDFTLKDCCDPAPGGQACSSSWHGTHVSGTIGARTNNGPGSGSGVAGVDWNGRILPVRVLGKCGGFDSDIIDAMRWSAGLSVAGVPANTTPAKVINMSLGSTGACPASYQSAIVDATGAGAVVIVAAGNDNSVVGTPGNCPGVITVAAVSRNGGKASYSNTGPEVELAAPGGSSPVNPDGVASTLNNGETSPTTDAYFYYRGTSMATPHVAGVAALMFAVRPTLTPAEVLSKLQSTARAFPTSGVATPCSTSACGAGLLDGAAALRALRPTAPTGFATTVTGVGQINWTWTAVSEATSYNVYVASDQAVLLANVGSASYTRSDLTANTTAGIMVKGVNLAGEGAGTVGPSTATYSTPSAITTAPPHVTSVTVNFTTVGGNSGYRVDAATASDFSGTVFSSITSNPASGRLIVSGLTTLTSYYLRIGTLNQLGVVNYAGGPQVFTLTDLAAPLPVALSAADSRTVFFSWGQGVNPSGQLYRAETSTASNFTGTVSTAAGIDLFSTFFGGLEVNTTYFMRVWASGGPAMSTGPVATYAISPATAAPSHSGLTLAAMRVFWTSGGNPPGTWYQSQISGGADFFTQPVLSSVTRNAFADFTGLSQNATYFARVRAVGHNGTPIPFEYVTLPSTPTLAATLTPAAPLFSAVSATALTLYFGDGGNPPGTSYVAQVSSSPTFAWVTAETRGSLAAGTNSASVTGLAANTTYYYQTASANHAGVASSFTPAAASTSTLAVPPTADTTAPTVYLASITFRWAGGVNRAGTMYFIQVSSKSDFSLIGYSSTTSQTSIDAVQLSSNTIHYARVRAVSHAPPNPDSAFLSLAVKSTLANPPTPAAAAFAAVTYTSMTVLWTPNPLLPQQAAAEGYRVELSTAANFGGILIAATVGGPAAAAVSINGLKPSTTYYGRVASLNWDGAAGYETLVIGSTQTLVPVLTSRTVSGGELLSVTPVYPEVRSIQMTVPSGAFPGGTVVEINASVEVELPPVNRSQKNFRLLGAAVGFSITAGGLQPKVPVPITLFYDLPLGTDPNLLVIGRYDDPSGLWVPLPSAVDTRSRTVAARTEHFSFFAPLLVDPGTNLDQIEIFPSPWEPLSDNFQHNAELLTLTKLPAFARVRIYTIAGEFVDEARAPPSGVLNWDGRNPRGTKVGTGTYLFRIDSAGKSVVRRVVVIR